jgi:ribosome recycling factor
MRRNIEALINEMKSKMSGYAVMLQYRYMNLCVKAEPVALLSFTVTDDEGEESNLEDVASACLANDYQFEIYPHDPKMVFAICKGIKEAHPEFKMDTRTEESDEESEENQVVIVCTMPDVNKDRHDVLIDGVDTLYDQCKAKLDANHATYKTRLTAKLVGFPEEDAQEAEDELEKVYKMHDDTCLQYKDEKVKEIEEAYQRYLDKQQQKKDADDERAAARGEDVKMQYRVGQEDD